MGDVYGHTVNNSSIDLKSETVRGSEQLMSCGFDTLSL